ncbi:DNA polymerase III subunit beta [[Mycoplasma] testudinis]|uniref:DNA polymerase III subunit beta n=1 Tax=[Mycoplasma] testudinis TaxID=33924 RepID=UPI000487ABBF|nr:DNA polymerase III subunit beta [[Mycoplasma] testudinis]
MKVTINKNVLIEALKFSNNIISNNISNAALSCVLLEITDTDFKVISSNGIISSVYKIKENIDIESPGKILVKGKLFFNIVSKIKEENIDLEEIDSSLQIKTKNYISNINTLDHSSFPNIDFDSTGWTQIKLNSKTLSTAVKKVSHSALQQIERVNRLNGIYFDSESEKNVLRIVATDSFKLSVFKTSYEGDPFKFLINANVMNLISSFLKLNEEVTFLTKNKNVMIETKDFILSCNVIDSDYPKIDSLINCSGETTLKISRHKLIEALDRVITFAISEKSSICNIKITNSVFSIKYKSLELGSSKEDIVIDDFTGQPIEFSVNASFLVEHLKAFDHDQVIFKIEGDLKPFNLEDEEQPGFLQVLVPMRSF